MALTPWASDKLCSALSSSDRAAIPFATGQSKCLVKKYVAHSGCGNNQYQPKIEAHLSTSVNGAQLRRCLELKHIRKTSIYTKALSVKVFTTEVIFSYTFGRLSKLSLKAVMHTVGDVIADTGNITTQQSLASVRIALLVSLQYQH